MNYLMMKMLGLVVMNEAPAADAGGAAGGSAPAAAAPAAPAAEQAPAAPAAQAAAPAAPSSVLGDTIKPADKPADAPAEEAAPVVPEAYELQMPEGAELDERAAPMVQDLFKKLGLSQEKANEVMAALHEIDAVRQPTPEQEQAFYEEQAASLNSKWGEECRKLEGLGGDNFEKSAEVCSQVVSKFGTQELRDFLAYSALGSHPEFFKFIHAIGSAMSQDTLEHGGAASKGPRSPDKIMWPALQ